MNPATRFGRLLPRFPRRILLWIVPLAFLAAFYLFPLGTIFRLGVEGALAKGLGSFTLVEALRVLGFTLWQALLSMLLTLALGLPGAWLFARCQFPGRRALRALTAVPFILPTIVVAVGFESLLGSKGWINLFLQSAGWIREPIPMVHTLGAILLAHVFYNASIVFRLVGNAWERLDPRPLDAARTLGADPWRAFREVTLPLLSPSILAAATLVFLFDVSSFGVILVLGGPGFSTLEVAIYQQTLQMLNLPAAALLSALQIACTLGLAVLIGVIASRSKRGVARVGTRAAVPPASRRGRIAVSGMGILLAVFFLAPLAAPVARSFLQWSPQAPPSVTLAYYSELFVNRRESAFFATPVESARNSLAVAACTAVFALSLGIPVAWALAHPRRGERLMEPFLLLPLGTSAVTLGVGLLLLYSSPAFALIRSPVMLVIAHSLVAFPFVVRTLRPAFAGIPRRLVDAARGLGASPLRAWRAVELPIVARAAASAGAFAFAISLGEFGATSLLVRPDFPTMPVAIYRLLALPGALNYGQAMAMASLLMLLCALSVSIIETSRLDSLRWAE
jgi:thiamine transport system permease protein